MIFEGIPGLYERDNTADTFTYIVQTIYSFSSVGKNHDPLSFKKVIYTVFS